MTTAWIVGELSPAEIDAGLYEVRHWERDDRNHRYLRKQLEDKDRDLLEPQCTKGRFTPAAMHAYRDELGPELDDARDHSEDCHPCFSPGGHR